MAYLFSLRKSPLCVVQTLIKVAIIVASVVLVTQWLHVTHGQVSIDPAETELVSWSLNDYDDGLEGTAVRRETPSLGARAGIYANALRQRAEIPDGVARGVKKLILFVGYPRSCHSLVASLLDAHPHVIISHEYDLVKIWQTWSPTEKANRTFVFNKIYNISRTQALYGLRSAVVGTHLAKVRDAYSYGVPNQWQGNFENNIELLGDKHGGRTSKYLSGAGRTQVRIELFEEMRTKLNIPLVFVHVMRNPYDNIATMALKQEKGRRVVNGSIKQNHLRNMKYLYAQAEIYCMKLAVSVASVRAKYDMVDIRCEDLVHDPVTTLQTLCQNLGLNCSSNYLTDCAQIVSSKQSRTRQFVDWPVWLKRQVATNLSTYTFLSERYKL